MNRIFSSTHGYNITTGQFRFCNYKLLTIIKWVVIIAVTSALSFFIFFRVDTHLRIYVRHWLSPPKPVVVEPLSTAGSCYSGNLAPIYRQGYETQKVNYIPGFRLPDDTCFGYAATISEPVQVTAINTTASTNDTENPVNGTEIMYFHTHWSSEDNRQIFGEAQLATVRSFVATQQTPATALLIWIYEEDEIALTRSVAWQAVEKHTDRVMYKVIAEEPISFGALAKYGGLWFDMNTLFVRDFSPLLGGNDWMAQGTCFTSVDGNPFWGSSIMYFHKDSPHLCELKNAATATTTGAIADNEDVEMESALFYRVYQRILRNGYKPWAIVPWCYVDPSQCKKPNRLQDPFDSSVAFDQLKLDSIFAYHYHSNPPSNPSGAIYAYLDDKYLKTIHW